MGPIFNLNDQLRSIYTIHNNTCEALLCIVYVKRRLFSGFKVKRPFLRKAIFLNLYGYYFL